MAGKEKGRGPRTKKKNALKKVAGLRKTDKIIIGPYQKILNFSYFKKRKSGRLFDWKN